MSTGNGVLDRRLIALVFNNGAQFVITDCDIDSAEGLVSVTDATLER